MAPDRTIIIIAMAILAIPITVIPLSNISHFPYLLTMKDAFAQAEVASEGNLKLVYTKLGALSGTYQQIMYDSSTNSLGLTNISASATAESEAGKQKLSSSQASSQSQSNKELSESDQSNLRQSIGNSEILKTNAIYPPDTKGAQDYTLNVLGITMGDTSHTAIWTDTSSNVPAGLESLAKTIENFASRS